jgi:hypothetical protein
MITDDHIDILVKGVMACHKKSLTLDAIQEAVKVFFETAEAIRPQKSLAKELDTVTEDL